MILMYYCKGYHHLFYSLILIGNIICSLNFHLSMMNVSSSHYYIIIYFTVLLNFVGMFQMGFLNDPLFTLGLEYITFSVTSYADYYWTIKINFRYHRNYYFTDMGYMNLFLLLQTFCFSFSLMMGFYKLNALNAHYYQNINPYFKNDR